MFEPGDPRDRVRQYATSNDARCRGSCGFRLTYQFSLPRLERGHPTFERAEALDQLTQRRVNPVLQGEEIVDTPRDIPCRAEGP